MRKFRNGPSTCSGQGVKLDYKRLKQAAGWVIGESCKMGIFRDFAGFFGDFSGILRVFSVFLGRGHQDTKTLRFF